MIFYVFIRWAQLVLIDDDEISEGSNVNTGTESKGTRGWILGQELGVSFINESWV